jgi:ribosomal protein L17
VQVKAKVVRSYVDKMITLAKDGSLHARRQVRACPAVMHLNQSRGKPHL